MPHPALRRTDATNIRDTRAAVGAKAAGAVIHSRNVPILSSAAPKPSFPAKRALRVTTVLCPLFLLSVRHSLAQNQSVGPGNIVNYSGGAIGTTGGKGDDGCGCYFSGSNDGGPGGSGGTQAGTNITVVNNTTIRASAGIAAQVISNGGAGGKGGDGRIPIAGYSGNGGSGGDGGRAYSLNGLTINAGASVQSTTGQAIFVSTDGGRGGDGGGIQTSGTGGRGGAGGDAGYSVLQTLAGSSIETSGPSGIAIRLQANGGAPGTSQNTTYAASPNVYGPGGGFGGAGGAVLALLAGKITATSTAILAEARGANGGDGGDAYNGLGVNPNGGTGGLGGRGGQVQLTFQPGSSTTVSLQADNTTPAAVAIARSIGGAGGNGGSASGGSGAKSGQGGTPGNGGSVSISEQNSTIAITGSTGAGLLAQSIGGSGGNSQYANGLFNVVGGKGAPGGSGGPATIAVQLGGSSTLISTAGTDSSGLLAQSIGGGGGYGGSATAIGLIHALALGGDGGSGGAAGPATISMAPGPAGDPASAVLTTGIRSPAVAAQSVGGGGGSGGSIYALNLGVLSLTIGANGGSGGTAGAASATNGETLQTGGGQSSGLVAQSIGGGGGAGGAANSLQVGVQFNVAVAVGGRGGTGGDASTAATTNNGQIVTMGPDSYGILAQSIGGGGGSGGAALSEVVQLFNTSKVEPEVPSFVLNAAVGGTGGASGNGNTVTADNEGAIITEGAKSHGILAQSVGGGGGTGGDSSAVNIALLAPTVSATVVVGGTGGASGRGGNVTATNNGLILSLGKGADGIFAQSVGGGGGGGGFAQADTGTVLNADKTVQLTATVGGSGGGGGDAGSVTANNTLGGILTRGDGASGIFAQSVGGGGGDGGFSAALGSGGGLLNVNVAVGGGGGGGGNGGAVSVANKGAILTTGASAPGIMAQSVGGGGGRGGDAATGAGTDPEVRAADYIAGGLGIGAKVVTTSNGVYTIYDNVKGDFSAIDKLTNIVTSYDKANDVLAPPAPNDKADNKPNLSIDVGAGFAGKGGSAGSGNTVSVTNDGSIATRGALSDGILAQSIGGGGGGGGVSNPAPSNDQFPKFNIDAAIGVGGRGGSSGNGGTITVTNTGSIETAGDASSAIRAQSVGGGGGGGGLTTAQNGIFGKLAIAVGGDGGSNGNGGAIGINLSNNGSSAVTTRGRDASAVLAQSIGGGGGLAALMGTTVPDNSGGRGQSNTGVINNVTLPSLGILSLTVDGQGGSAGNGGPVAITLDRTSNLINGGILNTFGVDSYGVLAQSIGGGGGLVIGVPDANAKSVLSTLLPANKANGNGGPVNITLKNYFSMGTAGAGSAGIVAQSIGGGGGLIGGLDKVNLASGIVATPVAENGQGGDVTVNLGNGGNLTTNGTRAHGIVAVSLGGGGGILDQADGNGFAFAGKTPFDFRTANVAPTGTVKITLDNNTLVRASGAEAYSIYAASQGNGTNAVKINVGSNDYVESWGKSAGAIFVSGAGGRVDNVITNAGSIDNGRDPKVPGGPSPNATGVAIAGTAPVTVNNTGSITGSVTNGNGSAFNNAAGAVFNPGPVIDLGRGGQLSNQGVLALGGGSSGVATTQLTGDLSQGNTGTTVVRLDARSNQSDQLHVTGTATLAGQLTVRLLNPAGLKPGSRQANFLTADGGVDARALSAAFTASPVLQYGPTQMSGNTVAVSYTVDFSGAQALAGQGLGSANRLGVGNVLNAIQASGGVQGTDALIGSLTELGSAQALADLYDSLSGAIAADAQQVVFGAQQAYQSTLSQHLWNRLGAGDPAAALAPAQTDVWIAGLGSSDRLQGTDGQRTLNAQTAGAMIGIDHSPIPGVTVGVSLGGGSSDFSVSNENSKGSNSFVNAALYGLAQQGEFYSSASLTYGHFSTNLHRYDIAGVAGLQASGHQRFDSNVVGGRIELGWAHRLDGVTVTPYVAQDLDQLWQGSSVETGPAGDPATTSALALRYAGVSRLSAPLTLGTRLNTTFTVSGTHQLSPYLDVGWMHEFSPSRSVDVAFLAAPDLSFRIKGVSASRDAALVNVGGALSVSERLSLLAAFNGRLSGVERSYGGFLKLQYAL